MNDQADVQLSLLFAHQWLKENKLPDNAPLRDLPYNSFWLHERLMERSWKAINWPKMDRLAEGADWLFSPADTFIPLRKIPSAITIHDIQAFEENLPWSNTREHQTFRMRWQLWIPKLIKHTDLIFTVSEFSRQRLIEKLKIDEKRVFVSGNAVDQSFLNLCEKVTAQRRDYPFLTVIGGLRPKKGGNEILLVADKLRKAWPEVRLIIWGENDEALLQKASEFRNIEILPMIPDEEMIALIKGAEASLFLSWYEGFGLPVLESMACGTPVICSNQASLPEVAGDAALLAHPSDTNQIVDYVLQLKDDSVKKELSEKGLANSHGYSWERAAQNVTSALKSSLSN
jgi:glycosyltransferase involved in cell wall biosynthesis